MQLNMICIKLHKNTIKKPSNLDFWCFWGF